MSGFHEVRVPDSIAYGATGGPEFATTVVATSAGHEKRNINWAEARGRWDVASGLKKQAQIDELIAFFRARRGKAYGFRFEDWTDYKAILRCGPSRSTCSIATTSTACSPSIDGCRMSRDGRRFEVHLVVVLTLRDSKIAAKRSYRKGRL